jgi:lysophospholipid acyltransferase
MYYDIATFFITQVAFAYTVAPFVLLSFRDSITVWSRVYFYTLFGVAVSIAMFARQSPVRAYLVRLQKTRTDTATSTAKSNDEADTSIDAKKVEKVARDQAQEQVEDEYRRDTRRPRDPYEHRSPVGAGVPDDLELEVDEIVAEVRREIEERKRRGSLVQGFDVRRAVDEKVKQLRGR